MPTANTRSIPSATGTARRTAECVARKAGRPADAGDGLRFSSELRKYQGHQDDHRQIHNQSKKLSADGIRGLRHSAEPRRTLHELHLLGLSPVITHPERNRLIRAQPERLSRWLHQGCYVQITAQSLLGKWGKGVKKQVEEWLDAEMVHFFASDGHNASPAAKTCRSVRSGRAA